MANSLAVTDFLKLAASIPILDVRSPGEFHQGHIPGAVSFPLFSDEERKIVGTLYKEIGKEAALLAGLDFVGPKMSEFVRKAVSISPERQIMVHCWRGGMRSRSMSWLLQSAGFQVHILDGGYKSFRFSVLNQCPVPKKMVILGGYTGTMKTEILRTIASLGEQTLDLEHLAKHKGSTFGRLPGENQPTQEQFENELFMQLFKTNPEKTIWIEDESQRIGNLNILHPVFLQMRVSTIFFLKLSLEQRVRFLVHNYGNKDPEELAAGFTRIRNRLGGLRYKNALEFLKINNLEEATKIALEYYDKTYTFGYNERKSVCKQEIEASGKTNLEIAFDLIEKKNQLFGM